MSATHGSYLHKRLLRINVGFLLSEGPGNARGIPIQFLQRVQVDDDLFLSLLTGKLVLTRTKEGILVQGTMNVGRERECDRCLDGFEHRFDLDVAELFASPPDVNKSAFFVDSNGEIDLAPLLREEVFIETSYRAVCRDDCRGLNAETGDKLSKQPEPQKASMQESPSGSEIDPRMAVLKQLLQ